LDLPSELIEDICGVLVEQNRQRSLAALNIANKFLRELTKRFLWENVRWTPKTWNHKLYLREGVPEIFVHVKYVQDPLCHSYKALTVCSPAQNHNPCLPLPGPQQRMGQ
jgi:hypothetical protein